MNLKKLSVINDFPKYSVHFLSVGDADAIFLTYQANAEAHKYVILVDAGNVSDSGTIKSYLLSHFGTNVIDLAVCTHPDKDHKGGFFDLIQDKEIVIQRFWIKNPVEAISSFDFARMKRSDSKEEACLRIFNHPNPDNPLNLIRLAEEKHIFQPRIRQGVRFEEVPFWVIGPSEELYHEAALGMVSEFAELVEDPNLAKYNELEEVDEDSAKSVINEKKEESFTNMSSLVLFFRPTDKFSIILAGDASCASLVEIERIYGNDIDGSVLKVPHHGSKRNMNTDLIDNLHPRASVISAAGNEKHPNSNLVYYLSKYGNVYSTHKTRNLYYTNEEKITNPAQPLKSKIK